MPEIVTSHFHLREGDKVADFGAGRGFFLHPLAKAVGPTGEVVLCEIQKELVEFVGEQIRQAGYSHVKPVWCDLEEADGVPVAADSLDAAICVNTVFQIEDRPTMVKEMKRTLRRGAKLYVIDWTESEVGMGPRPGQLIPRQDCIDLLESHEFVLEQEFPAGEHHYGLAFRNV